MLSEVANHFTQKNNKILVRGNWFAITEFFYNKQNVLKGQKLLTWYPNVSKNRSPHKNVYFGESVVTFLPLVACAVHQLNGSLNFGHFNRMAIIFMGAGISCLVSLQCSQLTVISQLFALLKTVIKYYLQAKEPWETTSDEKVSLALHHKAKGTDCFKVKVKTSFNLLHELWTLLIKLGCLIASHSQTQIHVQSNTIS